MTKVSFGSLLNNLRETFTYQIQLFKVYKRLRISDLLPTLLDRPQVKSKSTDRYFK